MNKKQLITVALAALLGANSALGSFLRMTQSVDTDALQSSAEQVLANATSVANGTITVNSSATVNGTSLQDLENLANLTTINGNLSSVVNTSSVTDSLGGLVDTSAIADNVTSIISMANLTGITDNLTSIASAANLTDIVSNLTMFAGNYSNTTYDGEVLDNLISAYASYAGNYSNLTQDGEALNNLISTYASYAGNFTNTTYDGEVLNNLINSYSSSASDLANLTISQAEDLINQGYSNLTIAGENVTDLTGGLLDSVLAGVGISVNTTNVSNATDILQNAFESLFNSSGFNTQSIVNQTQVSVDSAQDNAQSIAPAVSSVINP